MTGKGHGVGGTCFGDSGGPIFLKGTRTIVGVGSYVLNLNCKGTAFYYRTDLQSSHDFIDGFLND
ncbi:MAG: trypsin-like serine protease [Planctomycetota bacterium]